MAEDFAVDVDLAVRAILRGGCGGDARGVHTQEDSKDEGGRDGEEEDLRTLGHMRGCLRGYDSARFC